MIGRFRFHLRRLRERLWVKPLTMCLVSVAAALLMKTADYADVAYRAPDISPETIETLLKIIAASMLVIATFAVSSMVSSYASAGGTATPRSLALIISDDVSQNALSSFIGAFIYSLVALVALLNDFYDSRGLFAIFCLTLLVLAGVILTFVRWVDCIARLGRLGNTIDKVEKATATALDDRRRAPTLGANRADTLPGGSLPIHSETVGYVQHVDVPRLQDYAAQAGILIQVAALPGTFCSPAQPLAYIVASGSQTEEVNSTRIRAAFSIGDDRTYSEDPRFGIVALSEIASRALSPAVNDPGTAIDIIGTFVRLFLSWNTPVDPPPTVKYDRVEVPALDIHDMFDDAFRAIGRDGAGVVEVGIRMQKALHALALAGGTEIRDAARHQSAMGLARAKHALTLPADFAILQNLGHWVKNL